MPHQYRLESFQPTPDPPMIPWAEWKAEFDFYLYNEEKEAEEAVQMKLLSIPGNPTLQQQAGIDALAMTDEKKVRKFLSHLGSEAMRQFMTKTGTAWDRNHIANKTIAQATEIGDQLFGDLRHPLTALIDLYAARGRSSESTEQFITRLRHLARDCKLGNQEDRRLMECLVFTCNEREPLDKIIELSRDYPTLPQVTEILQRYESTRKGTGKLLGRTGRAKTEIMAAKAYSGDEEDSSAEDNSDVDSIAESLSQLAIKLKKGTGSNRNYRVPRGKKHAQPASRSSNGPGGTKKTNIAKGSVCANCLGSKCEALNGGTCRAIGKKCYECGGTDHSCQRRKSKASPSSQATITQPAVVHAEEDRITIEVKLQVGLDQQKRKVSVLADTGAQVTTLTHRQVKERLPGVKLWKSNKMLTGFGGTARKVLGKFPAKLSFQSGREASIIVYVVPDDCLDLLGIGDMGLIGVKIDTETKTAVNACQVTGAACNMEAESAQLQQLHKKYPQVFSDNIGQKRGYEHEIRLKPGSIPVQMGPRRIPFNKEKPTAEELDYCIKNSIMEKVPGAKSLWSSPMHAVAKPETSGGGVRVTADYSGTINPCIIPTLHMTPTPAEIFLRARNAKVLSKLDVVKAYWHILLAKHCRHLTAFMTKSHGLLQYCRLPMGMTDSAASFQKAIEHCLVGIENSAPYIDDILVWGATQEEHDKTLDEVISRLDRDGFRLSAKKCLLNQTEVTMLGQRLTVTDTGLDICPDPERTMAICEAPNPSNIKELHRFLGMANYFASYIPQFATIAEPLFRLKRKGVKFEWTDECETACQTIKESIAQPAILVPFDPECEVHIQTDASKVGLGACLMIERAGHLRPVAFASKSMTSAERNYSTPEQEALATVWACEKFNQFVFGGQFTLHTDQSSLGRLLSSFADKPIVSRRIQRWYDRLRKYDFKTVHIKGTENVIADYLSRLAEDTEPSDEPTLPDDDDEVILVSALTDTTISQEDLERATKEDEVCKTLARYLKTTWPNPKNIHHPALKTFYKCRDELSMADNLIFRGDRLVVPECLQSQIMHRLHEGHPGIVRMKTLYNDLYYWPAGRVDCEAFVQQCIPCSQAEKSVKPPAVPTGEFPPPQNPWEVLALDITGPFWEAPQRHENIAVLMDYFSKWPELFFTQHTTSMTIIRWLTEVFDSWGNPLQIITDNGPQFISDEFEEFLASCNIRHILTPVYCPQRNGLVERFNRVIKNSAQTYSGHRNRFRRHIMETVVSFRAIAPADSASPAMRARGWNIRTSAAIYNPRFRDGGVEDRKTLDLESRKQTVRNKQSAHASPGISSGKTRRPPKQYFHVGDIVQFVRPKSTANKGQSPLSRPIRVVSQISRWDFRLADGKIWNTRKLRRYRPAMHYQEPDSDDHDFVPIEPSAVPGTIPAPPAGNDPEIPRRGNRIRRQPDRLIEEMSIGLR